jgi:rifampicin phosphotransferase
LHERRFDDASGRMTFEDAEMVCTFRQFSDTKHTPLAGGKGKTLARLRQAGFPVPDGFIILASAFDHDGLSPTFETEVLGRFADLVASSPTGAVAVRSSAVNEDSERASFAGAFETVLGVSTEQGLLEAVGSVFRSAAADRPRDYAAALNECGSHSMAVVVQHMLAPDWAGVLFTADPVTGDTGTMHGSLVRGPGDSLVAGVVTGETFVIRADTGAYTGPSAFETFRADLFAMASDVARELGAPQDIEWAVHQGKVFLLQSRPITTLAPAPDLWNDSLGRNCLWCNTNLGELFGNVITPFTWSIFHEVVDRNVGPVAGHFMVGLVGGRSYFNISLVYSILKRLGKKRPDILHSFDLFLGEIPDDVEIPVVPVSWKDAIGFVFKQSVQAARSATGLRAYLAWARNEGPAWCAAKMRAIDSATTRADLLAAYQGIAPTVFRTFAMVAFVGDQFVKHEYALRKALSDVLAPEDVEVLESGLDGSGALASMGPLMGMSALMKGELTTAEFVERYGHRGPDEGEFASPRTAEDPGWLDRLKAQWHDADPEALLLAQRQRREAIWTSLERNPKRAARLRAMCETAATLAQNRELAKSENFRQAWVVRRFVQRAAEIVGQPAEDLFFLEKNELLELLRGRTDVLTHVEPRRKTYDAYRALPRLPSLIAGSIDPFQWARRPTRRTDVYVATRPEAAVSADGIIRGFPGSAGLVEGTVRVLTSHEQMPEFITGEILVTSFTNVGWTPLFPRAAAIVTDIGAPLSHAAIVARELGVPTVVGTGIATMRLRTGDRVRVDGSAGTVAVLRR